MADYEGDFADHSTPSFDRMKDVIKDPQVTGLNPGLMVLLMVGGIVTLFIVGNIALYMYAQKTLPPKKKKPVSKKKMKREKLRQGIAPPGE